MENEPPIRCVINFGMYSKEGPSEPHLFDRLRDYWLGLPWVLGPDVKRQLIIPADDATEPTLIASGVLVKGYNRHLDALLALTKQDCCAVFLPDERSGTLVGPRAKDWGHFDFNNFHLPEGYNYEQS